jgi:hypothetical protein
MPAAKKQMDNLSSLLGMQESRTAGAGVGNALITMALLNRMQNQLAEGDTEAADVTGKAIALHRIATTVADTADATNESLRAVRTAVGAPTAKNFAAAGAAAKSALLRGPVAGLGSLLTLAVVTQAMRNRAALADNVGVVLPELE